MAVNKVVFGNTTVMDITDTTAEADDVASGKEFYTKAGVKTTGNGDYARLSGAAFTGAVSFALAPTTADGNDEYLSTATLIAGKGISLTKTSAGLKITNTYTTEGDIIYSTKLTTPEEVSAAKGGTWILRSHEEDVYEWECIGTSGITITPTLPIVATDIDGEKSITVTATSDDPTATFTWSIEGGDDCVTIS